MKNKCYDVVVIGSGLSAYGAILAALQNNSKVLVLDIGKELPSEIANPVSDIDKKFVSHISEELFRIVRSAKEKGKKDKRDQMPKKTLFGSGYFYSEEILENGHILPYSEAFGGYSVAWGAATLTPRQEDLRNFGIDLKPLYEAMESVGRFISPSTITDSLTPYFPNYESGKISSPITMSASQKMLLSNISRLIANNSEFICLVGQARLMTSANGKNACKYCGMCSHGCLFGSIFSTRDAIVQLVNAGKIELMSNFDVDQLVELSDTTEIHSNSNNRFKNPIVAKQVFVAAGAVNSTKIALKSYELEEENVVFQKTGGFVRPYFSIKSNGFDWPNQNTQANIFMEIQDRNVSDFWIHSQISTPNEIVISTIGYLNKSKLFTILRPILAFILSHLVLVMTNLHSESGPYYEVKLEDGARSRNQFQGKLVITDAYRKFEKTVDRYLMKKFFRIGLLPVPFLRKGITSGPGYHLGGSLPMNGVTRLSTDHLGRFSDNSRISFVDTSVLPSIPATTIGFLTLANAFRITDTVLKLTKHE